MSRVLIVCEAAPTRSLIGEVVSRERHRPVIVTSAAAARALVERESFDLVVVDLATPDADGPRSLWTAEPNEPRPPILAVAAPDRSAARELAFEAEASAFVVPPVDERALRCQLRTLVELGRLRAARPSSAELDDRWADRLRASEARYRAMIVAIPDLLFRIDREYRFIDVSASDPSQLALPPEELLGKTIAEVYGGGLPEVAAAFRSTFIDQTTAAIDRAFASGQLQRFDYEYHDRWFEARIVRSGPDEVVAIARDVTELRRAEEALHAAVRARDDLLAVVSHDLRSPVATVRLSAEALAQHPRDDDRRRGRKQIDAILRATDRMSRLIDDLLQAALIEAGTFSVTLGREAPRALVDEALHAIEPVAAKRSVQVGAALPSTLPEIRCDRQRVIQVLLNLLGNAVKFSPSGGTVRVDAVPEAGALRFAVSDQGPGIAAASLPHVFDRYWKRTLDGQEGAGLGLYIARGIIDAHGGRIWVESQVGVGTTFYFTLPLA